MSGFRVKAVRLLESLLWRSRLVVVLAALVGTATAIVFFFVSVRDALGVIAEGVRYSLSIAQPDGALARTHIVAGAVRVLDGFLLGTLMLVLSLGLYSLFVKPFEAAKDNLSVRHVLFVGSIDDLKSRLLSVVIVVVVVRYFEAAMFLDYRSPLEVLMLAGSIVLVAVTAPLLHYALSRHAHDDAPSARPGL